MAVLFFGGCAKQERTSASLDARVAVSATETQLAAYTSQALVLAADSLFRNTGTKDRACVIYYIVAMRYKYDGEDAKSGIHANLKLWERYMFDFNNLSSAIEYLNDAAEISAREGLSSAEIDYAYAICYQSMGNHIKERELFKKALGYYESALVKIQKTGESSLYDQLIPNYLTLLYSMQEPMERARCHMDGYERSSSGNNSVSQYAFCLALYDGLGALQSGRFSEAATRFGDMRRHIGFSDSKKVYMLLLNEATALQRGGRTEEGLAVLDKAETLSSIKENPEFLVSLNYTRSKYWEMLGDTVNSRRFYVRYCQARDSLLSYRQISSLRKAEFARTVSQLDTKVMELEYKGKVKTVVILVSLLGMLLLSVAAVIIIKKNSELKRSNRALYEQNKEILAMEQREREEHRRRVSTTVGAAEAEAEKEVPIPASTKYSSRKLSVDVKNEIHDIVLETLNNSKELYSSDFSLARLSKICGSPPEYVSQVINETFGCSFNELVNKYRIREACRRIADKENYGQLTLAALAESVGIGSPTTFSKYFRKVTGLTPSQYKKNSDAEYSNS